MDHRWTPFAISLLVSMATMSCYHHIDDFFSVSNSINLKKCPSGYFINGQDCHPYLGCNELLDDVQVYHDVILTFWPSRMIKLANWKQKKLVKHHSLNNFNMENEFKKHLELFKEVLNDQLIGYCDAPGHFVFITDYQKGAFINHVDMLSIFRPFSTFLELVEQNLSKNQQQIRRTTVDSCLGCALILPLSTNFGIFGHFWPRCCPRGI